MDNRLDEYEKFPAGMRQYLSNYGWHFSKKLCEEAVSKMYRTSGDGKRQKIDPYTKERVDEMFKAYGIEVKNGKGYDACYVANMGKSDYMGSSISDERHIMLFVKDYIDDPDGYEGLPLTRYYADCIGKGTPIMWEDVL